jgi:hypothetical protein
LFGNNQNYFIESFNPIKIYKHWFISNTVGAYRPAFFYQNLSKIFV